VIETTTSSPPTADPGTDGAIRPFTYKATDAELEDLRARVAATRWPEERDRR
jgi:hypothetical protein